MFAILGIDSEREMYIATRWPRPYEAGFRTIPHGFGYMTPALSEHEPIRPWLDRHLAPARSELTPFLIKHSLGNQAEHAFGFDGYGLLEDFLVRFGSASGYHRSFVGDGVVELLNNLRFRPGGRLFGGRRRLDQLRLVTQPAGSRAAELSELAPYDVAVAAAHHFFLLARAAIEHARFVGPSQAAELASFETYRLALLGADASGGRVELEERLLAEIASWHLALDSSGAAALASRCADGVAQIQMGTEQLIHHSLVLAIVAQNRAVHTRLSDSAMQILSATMRLKSLNDSEAVLLAEIGPVSGNTILQDELEMLRNSVIALPRRGGVDLLYHEFDRLWDVYKSSVPWSTPGELGHALP